MRLLFAVLLAVLTFGCKQKAETSKNTPIANDTIKFFQVSQYIQAQLKDISSTPYYIYKTVTIAGKKDSVAASADEVQELTQQFIKHDLNDKSFKPYFTESVFFDQTTKTFSINYSTANKELILQNVDIVLKEDGKTVKRIFLRKFFDYNDSTAIEQLTWKPNQSFQINRLVEFGDSKESTTETSVVWNEKDNRL